MSLRAIGMACYKDRVLSVDSGRPHPDEASKEKECPKDVLLARECRATERG
jgi:hypothetical protein